MDLIDRQAALDKLNELKKVELVNAGGKPSKSYWALQAALMIVSGLPSAQPEIIRCRDCKHWRQQTNYAGASLSFGFCESDDMWRSLYGETYEVSHIDTDDDFYCGYAERRENG